MSYFQMRFQNSDWSLLSDSC